MRATSSPDAEPGVRADFRSLEQAADWYAVLYAGEADADHREAWSRWMAERAENRQAWAHIESVSRRIVPLRREGVREANAAAVTVSARLTPGRRKILGVALAALGGPGLAGWLAWRDPDLRDRIAAWRSDYSTGVGERRDIRLADGTQVWLNTGSAFDADYSTGRRALRLTGGEMLVETGRDGGGRPFYVTSRNGRMQALGTRFTVRETPGATLLAVYEGCVRIRNLAGDEAVVEAGRQRTFTAQRIDAEAPAEPAREAWSRGLLLADDIPLGALFAELGRYRHGHIAVDPQVAGIRVVGRFPIGNADQTFAMLERDLPIRIRQPLPWWITVSAR
ncbi:MAG: FecR domain-containing protein [Burkholderia sp.]